MSQRLSRAEGALAPQMVSQNTAPSSRSITGMPVAGPVSSRSSRRSRAWTSSGRAERQASAMAAARRATAALSSPSSAGHVSAAAGRRAMSSTAVRRASSPCPLRAAAVTTGTPRPRDRASVSTATPFFRASSIRFRHSTSRGVQQRSCTASSRLRRRQVASATTTVTSASPPQMKSRASCSSGESARREYVPGRSMSRKDAPCQLYVPSATAPVLPGQCPVCWCMPVRALNTVDFPTLGVPASAAMYCSMAISSFLQAASGHSMRRRGGGCGVQKRNRAPMVRGFFFAKGERITMSLTYFLMLS